MIRRGGLLALGLVVAALLVPAAAGATPPTLAQPTQTNGVISASWTLPAGMLADYIDVSQSSRVDSYGDFVIPLLGGDLLTAAQTMWTATSPLPPGKYYVHVAAICQICSADEFSAALSVDIPGQSQNPAPAALGPPGQTSRHLLANWTLAGGTDAYFVEAAASPDANPAGDFKSPVLFDIVDPDQTSYASLQQLAPGTYYVHVGTTSSIGTSLCPTGGEIGCYIYSVSSAQTVTILPDPATPPAPRAAAPSPPPPPPPDKVTAFAALTAASSQDIDKLVVSASMGEAGTLTAGGTVSVPGASKVFRFKPASAKAVPGLVVKLKLKLPKKALKAAKRALKRHKKLKAKLTITAKDAAGNVKTEKRTVKLRP